MKLYLALPSYEMAITLQDSERVELNEDSSPTDAEMDGLTLVLLPTLCHPERWELRSPLGTAVRSGFLRIEKVPYKEDSN